MENFLAQGANLLSQGSGQAAISNATISVGGGKMRCPKRERYHPGHRGGMPSLDTDIHAGKVDTLSLTLLVTGATRHQLPGRDGRAVKQDTNYWQSLT